MRISTKIKISHKFVKKNFDLQSVLQFNELNKNTTESNDFCSKWRRI